MFIQPLGNGGGVRVGEHPFRILHLSDLHLGTGFFLYDESTSPEEWARRLAKHIERGLNSLGIEAEAREASDRRYFDLLVVSGDFTNSSEGLGRTAAEYFFKEVQGSAERLPLWWAADDILLIPGNHDFDFGKRPPEGEEGPRLLLNLCREQRQVPYRSMYQNITRRVLGTEEWLGVVKLYPEHRLTVLGLDSCRLESWQAPGMGFVGLDQIKSMADEILGKEAEENQRAPGQLPPWHRLAFVHHHLVGKSDEELLAMRDLEERCRGTFTWDAEKVVWALQQYGVDFILHGHEHRPDLRSSENSAEVFGRVLGAGSVAAARHLCLDLHHFYVLEIKLGHERADKHQVRTVLEVKSLTCGFVGDQPGTWTVASPPPAVLSREPALRSRGTEADLEFLAQDALDFCLAFEDWPLARMFFTEQDTDIWISQLGGISYSCEEVWNKLRAKDSGLPAWNRAMAILLTDVRTNGKDMLTEFEGFLNGGARRGLRDMLIGRVLRNSQLSRIRSGP